MARKYWLAKASYTICYEIKNSKELRKPGFCHLIIDYNFYDSQECYYEVYSGTKDRFYDFGYKVPAIESYGSLDLEMVKKLWKF